MCLRDLKVIQNNLKRPDLLKSLYPSVHLIRTSHRKYTLEGLPTGYTNQETFSQDSYFVQKDFLHEPRKVFPQQGFPSIFASLMIP